MIAPCTLDLQDNDQIAIVILNDPKTTNAMSPEMGDAFREIMTGLATREGLRVVIIRGAGENFSIGGHRDMLVNLGSDKFDHDGRRDYMLGYYAKWLPMIDVPVPVIAAIEGQCIGVAPVFALVSDIALADEAAQFEITFAKAGFFPGMGLVKLVPDAIGRSRAGLTLMAGARFSGAEVEQMGVVARSVTIASDQRPRWFAVGGSEPAPLQRANVILQVNSAADHLSDSDVNTTLLDCLSDRLRNDREQILRVRPGRVSETLEAHSAEETPNFAASIQQRALSSRSLPQ